MINGVTGFSVDQKQAQASLALTVSQLIDKRYALEKEIANLLVKFSDETRLGVSGINLSQDRVISDAGASYMRFYRVRVDSVLD